jgi:NADH-quinone oxidoreductase subunit M
MVIMGTYTSIKLGKFAGVDAILAAAGVILAAIYMLGVVQRVFFGPVKNPKNRNLPDLNTREIIALTPLVVMIFVIGLFPSAFLSRMSDSVSSFDTRSRQVWIASQALGDGPAKLLTNEELAREAGGVDKGLLEKLERMDVGAPALTAQEGSK